MSKLQTQGVAWARLRFATARQAGMWRPFGVFGEAVNDPSDNIGSIAAVWAGRRKPLKRLGWLAGRLHRAEAAVLMGGAAGGARMGRCGGLVRELHELHEFGLAAAGGGRGRMANGIGQMANWGFRKGRWGKAKG